MGGLGRHFRVWGLGFGDLGRRNGLKHSLEECFEGWAAQLAP